MSDSSNAKDTRVDYQEIARQMDRAQASTLQSEIQKKLNSISTEGTDTLTHRILKLVVEERYDVAQADIEEYCDARPEYPQFLERASRLRDHCLDLMNAIQSKRAIVTMANLPMAKKQEVHEKVLVHFDELRHYLRKIELIDKDVRIEDIRSTVWVVRALVVCTFTLLFIYVSKEAYHGIAQSATVVIEDSLDQAVNWLFDKLGM